MADSELSGVILAGGYSRRFGSDKARVILRGREFADHVVSRLAETTAETILVVREDQLTENWPGDLVVSDDPELPAGPLRGIVTGLGAARHQLVAVASVDSPIVEPLLFKAMSELLAGLGEAVPGVVAENKGRLQPLIGVYHKSTEHMLRAILAGGEQSVTRVVNGLPFRIVDEQWCRMYDPDGSSFVNVNTPAELAVLRETAGE